VTTPETGWWFTDAVKLLEDIWTEVDRYRKEKGVI
jgi:hypothetical protein